MISSRGPNALARVRENETRMTLDRRSLRARWPLCIILAALEIVTSSTFALAGDVDQRSHIDQFVREAVANELGAQQHDHSLWRYREIKREDGKTQSIVVVETRQCDLDRVVAVNGRPLGPGPAKNEDLRIQHLISDRKALEDQRRKEDHDFAGELRLLRMLPDAFIYRETGRSGSLVKLDFRPNPDFRPSDREGDVFHHMSGTVWFDASQKRLARISGRLTSEVKFGWGILGHLAKGGTFFVEQRDLGGGHWELATLDVNMNGKILFFKTINVKETLRNSDFKPVPANVTLEEAAQMIKRESATPTENTDADAKP